MLSSSQTTSQAISLETIATGAPLNHHLDDHLKQQLAKLETHIKFSANEQDRAQVEELAQHCLI